MRQHHRHGDRVLTVGGELGPVLRDRCVGVEQPRCISKFAQTAVTPLVVLNVITTVSRVHGRAPVASALPAQRSTTGLPVAIHRDRCADVAVSVEASAEGIGNLLEAGLDGSMQRGHAPHSDRTEPPGD